MALFAVIVERAGAWNWRLPMRKQNQWDEHAAFMDMLVAEGFICAGGPLGGEDVAPHILHIIESPSKDAVMERLAQDPWHRSGHLQVLSIEPWTILLGAVRRSV